MAKISKNKAIERFDLDGFDESVLHRQGLFQRFVFYAAVQKWTQCVGVRFRVGEMLAYRLGPRLHEGDVPHGYNYLRLGKRRDPCWNFIQQGIPIRMTSHHGGVAYVTRFGGG